MAPTRPWRCRAWLRASNVRAVPASAYIRRPPGAAICTCPDALPSGFRTAAARDSSPLSPRAGAGPPGYRGGRFSSGIRKPKEQRH